MKALLELSRPWVSLSAAFSAGTGYMLIAPSRALGAVWIPVLGVFLLAAGASALNQAQERSTDALMERTKLRPLPSGRISPSLATTFALSMIVIGLIVLAVTAGFKLSTVSCQPIALGVLAVIWYNGFYTPLKRRWAFAAVPGALVGAVPPAIGWTLGGGSLFDAPLLVLMNFLFLWQVPHFWLIVLNREAEYRGAGFPLPTDRIPPERFRAILLNWMAAASLVALSMPLFGALRNPLLYGTVAASILVMAWLGVRSLFDADLKSAGIRAFSPALNMFALLVLVLSAAGRLMSVSLESKVQSLKLAPEQKNLRLETRDSRLPSSISQLLPPNPRPAGRKAGPHV